MPKSTEDAADDEIEQVFPGCVLAHVFTIVAPDQLDIAIEALEAVRQSGGQLEALHLTRVGGSLDHRLKVVGLRPHQARSLAGRLGGLPGVDRAVVEHHLLQV